MTNAIVLNAALALGHLVAGNLLFAGIHAAIVGAIIACEPRN